MDLKNIYNQQKFTKRQKDILSAALNIIATEGTKGLTLKKVSNYVGITDAAIYKHFKNKRHLILCLYDYIRSIIISTISPIVVQKNSAKERISILIDTVIEYLIAHKGVNLILLAESIYHNDEELREAMLSIFQGVGTLIKTLLLAGIATKEFKEELDPDMTTICLIGMIQATLTRYMLEKEANKKSFNLDKMKESIKKNFFYGITKNEIF